jgi:non-specific serine/threonine protein kinase
LRFRLLEPIRQYAGVRLDEAGERHALARRHLEWVGNFAQQAFSEFFVEQRESTGRIRQEHPNISQALEFAIVDGDAVTAARIVAALGYPWFTVGQPDGRLWCERVLALVPADAPARTRAGALYATALMLQEASQYDAARNLLLEALELYRTAKSIRGEAWTLTSLGRVAYLSASGTTDARALLEEALSRCRESNLPAGAGWCLAFLAGVAMRANDDALARDRAEEAVQLGRSTHIGEVVAEGIRVLAMLDMRAGDFDSADRRLAETIAIHQAVGDRYQLIAAHGVASQLAASRGDPSRAASHLAAGAHLARDIPEHVPWIVESAAYVAYMDGQAANAAVLHGAALSLNPTFSKQSRRILEALREQGYGDEIAAGANLDADEALKHVIALASTRSEAPA